MTPPEKQQFMKQLALWSRVHGKKRPTTKDGWKILLAEFIAQSQAPAEDEQPAWNEVPDQDETHLIDDGATVQIADVHKEGVFEDDWDRLLRDRAAASVGPNGELLDDFDTEFQMMGTSQAAIERAAPFTSINPRSVFTGALGGQQLVYVNGQSKMVARWQGEDSETLPVTIAFGPAFFQNVPNAVIPAGIRAYGRVIFGTHGQVVPVVVDITIGCQFTIGASSVVLEVGLDCPFTANNDIIFATLSGLISFHPSVRTAPVTSTKAFDLSTGDTGVQDVPSFAKELVVSRSDSTVVLSVTLRSGGGVEQTIPVAGGALMSLVQLPGTITKFQITNAAGTAGTINAIFNLGI
jgi:hypothetical protein